MPCVAIPGPRRDEIWGRVRDDGWVWSPPFLAPSAPAPSHLKGGSHGYGKDLS